MTEGITRKPSFRISKFRESHSNQKGNASGKPSVSDLGLRAMMYAGLLELSKLPTTIRQLFLATSTQTTTALSWRGKDSSTVLGRCNSLHGGARECRVKVEATLEKDRNTRMVLGFYLLSRVYNDPFAMHRF